MRLTTPLFAIGYSKKKSRPIVAKTFSTFKITMGVFCERLGPVFLETA